MHITIFQLIQQPGVLDQAIQAIGGVFSDDSNQREVSFSETALEGAKKLTSMNPNYKVMGCLTFFRRVKTIF